jgi:acyl-CoA thioester hydrolase
MKYLNRQFVRLDDIDLFGHVNNAKYLVFTQEARFHWAYVQFEERQEKPAIVEMVVARAEIDFIKPIYEGGKFVDVHLWVEKIGTSSFAMVFEISDNGVLFARVKSVQVAVSIETRKSRPLTDTEREFLNQYLEA